MFVNLSSFSFADAAKFIDPIFSRVNIMQVTFVSLSISDSAFFTDLFTLLRSCCLIMMIQECGSDYAKCTFVFTCSSYSFYKLLKLKTKLLIHKFGKEVFIHV